MLWSAVAAHGGGDAQGWGSAGEHAVAVGTVGERIGASLGEARQGQGSPRGGALTAEAPTQASFGMAGPVMKHDGVGTSVVCRQVAVGWPTRR